ncbi:hypothetical protein GQ55_8G036600 [Panicum hallii var. hallii]|uniref:Uncharacterized protein n=1 Tax=Panicum hallii var. hallii TaxID=1504633 RepID=A0A2T7CKD3_9POAL|nr:hypothetical protein GQ55_8G036600 [Panicum hallii var. hallii]
MRKPQLFPNSTGSSPFQNAVEMLKMIGALMEMRTL